MENNKTYLILYFKILMLLYIGFVICNDCLSQYDYEDKIKIKLDPDTLIALNNYDFINLSLENISDDTLLTIIEPFSFEGLNPNRLIEIGAVSSYFRPNFIGFEQKGKKRSEGRGEYPLEFTKIPKILIIKPNSIYLIKINLFEEYKEYLFPLNWNLFSCVWYREKKIIDSVINIEYKNLFNEYNNSIINCDTLNIWGELDLILFKKYYREDKTFEKITDIDKILSLFKLSTCYCKVRN